MLMEIFGLGARQALVLVWVTSWMRLRSLSSASRSWSTAGLRRLDRPATAVHRHVPLDQRRLRMLVERLDAWCWFAGRLRGRGIHGLGTGVTRVAARMSDVRWEAGGALLGVP